MCFVHFDLKMCFAPQRRAIFPYPDFKNKKCSETVSFLAFWLANGLRATAACNFLTSQLQKVVREWCVWYILTCKCGSRHSGVNFYLTSQLQKVVRAWCVLCILTWKCASRHSGVQVFQMPTSKSVPNPWDRQFFNILTWKCVSRYSGVQFFISPLNSYLRTRRFSEPTFRPSGNTNHWKNASFRDFPNISRDCIFFFWLCFSALLFIFPSCRKLDP